MKLSPIFPSGGGQVDSGLAGRAFALVGLLARAHDERDDVLATLRAIREPVLLESDSVRIVG